MGSEMCIRDRTDTTEGPPPDAPPMPRLAETKARRPHTVLCLLRTDSESVETTLRRRRIWFAGFVARMGEERLPRRVKSGEMLGGRGYCGGQEWDWMKDLEEDLKAFGIKFEGWRKAAQKVGR